jgi:hypothetical protein
MATANQLQNWKKFAGISQEWQRKDNGMQRKQLKRAEIVLLLYYLATGNQRVMTFEGFCYFFAIF